MAESLEASTQEIFPPLRPHQKVDEEDGEKKKEEEPLKSDFSTKEDASPSQHQGQENDTAEGMNEDKKKRGGKPKRVTKKETENKDEKKQAPRAKKARATKPQEEPDYFKEKRNLQDLWKAAFPGYRQCP
ncbi:PREDICTED: vicilin-like seed storage protein At2g18540 [Camelina sativa]|uniref:Vicilin-like seed storage protein At2g18540 n=1 Tax=Camelina sativa TaxID=90675 RepID=A0ABM1QGQ3_CAMSA|nr:PREDICTED: vicilin-like seed storage protein At2g18540 [Camelina sativa]